MRGAYPPPDEDWWIVGPGHGTCAKCGEDDTRGLISKVVDARGTQMVCSVCSYAWWVKLNASAIRDVGGHAIDGP